MSAIKQAISDVQAGKYVDLDIASAYYVISKTQLLGTGWDIFLEHGQNAVLHTEFCTCINIDDLHSYVLHDLERPAHEGENLPLPDHVRNSFDSAAIYCQKYDIEVEGTKGKIFIWRTPTEINFDRARAVILFVLEFFRQLAKGEKFVASSQNPEITITIRGMEKFYDIKIESGINNEAWVGFDFR